MGHRLGNWDSELALGLGMDGRRSGLEHGVALRIRRLGTNIAQIVFLLLIS